MKLFMRNYIRPHSGAEKYSLWTLSSHLEELTSVFILTKFARYILTQVGYNRELMRCCAGVKRTSDEADHSSAPISIARRSVERIAESDECWSGKQ